MFRILQINVNRSRTATDMALATARHLQVDIILISEPNKALTTTRKEWLSDERKDSAIIILNRNVKVSEQGSGDGYTYMKTAEYTIFSCYSSGNRDLTCLENTLEDIATHTRNTNGHCVIAGDFNSKSPQWGMKKTDERGIRMEEWIAQNELVLLNDGSKPTFQSGNYTSILDLTFVTQDLRTSVTKWDVLEEDSVSDHHYIMFGFNTTTNSIQSPIKAEGWQTKKLNVDKVREEISALRWEGQITAGNFSSKLKELCDKAMPRRATVRNLKPVYWWNKEIAKARNECIQKRRTYTRAAKRSNLVVTTHLWNELQKSRTILRGEIKTSKRRMWKKLCDDIDRDIWGEGYKILMKSTIGLTPISRLTIEQMEEAARYFFPPQVPDIGERTVINDCDNETVIFLHFTIEELKHASDRLKEKKAPGPGLVPAEMLKIISNTCPAYLLNIYNVLAGKGVFPTEWKMAKLVMIPKGNKQTQDLTMQRPLCLLDAEGKLFELLIESRLEAEIERTGGISKNQFGFRKGCQTTDAVGRILKIAKIAESYTWKHRRICAMITLDVRNAFNSACWHQILDELHKRGIDNGLLRLITSYLCDRRLILDNGHQKRLINVYRGVPQGSILGPKLWNILYDDLFKLDLPQGVTLTGFADDVALTITAKTEGELMNNGNAALEKVERWMAQRHLELAPHKSEAILLTHKRNLQPIHFNLMGSTFTPKHALKYLGVWLDTKMTFAEHFNRVSENVGKTLSVLTRVLPNIGGPRSSKRRVLTSIIHSKLLYGAPIWYPAMGNNKLKRKLLSMQRLAAIRVCSAYRTVSTAAVGVIAGIPPIDIMALERKEKYEGEMAADARRNLRHRWQARWDQEETGRWTRELIPNIEKWIDRPYGEVDYFLTQALSGHGCYRKYLYERNRADTSECRYCNQEDDARHTLFECIRWDEARGHFRQKTGTRFDLRTVRESLTAKAETWDMMYETIRTIIQTKENEDRNLERSN